jgi:hypothetical protein
MPFSIYEKLKFHGPCLKLILSLDIFMFILLLPEGRAGVDREPCNEVIFFLHIPHNISLSVCLSLFPYCSLSSPSVRLFLTVSRICMLGAIMK